jgi:hypothetical protein
MKKFSKISGEKISEEPKVQVSEKQNELNEFKHQIMKLMDDFLAIQSYGSARPEIMIPTRIVGKEMFVEALTDLLSQKSNDKTVDILESLKSTSNDWKSIDDKIDFIRADKKNIKEVNKITSIVKKYSDEGSLKIYMERYKKRLNTEQILEKSKVSRDLWEETMNPLYKVILNSLKNDFKS